jgi:hypothetical protein
MSLRPFFYQRSAVWGHTALLENPLEFPPRIVEERSF